MIKSLLEAVYQKYKYFIYKLLCMDDIVCYLRNISGGESGMHVYATAAKMMMKNAAIETTEYIKPHLSNTMLFDSRDSNLLYALQHSKKINLLNDKSVFVEFGVWKGATLKIISNIFKDNKVFGFDSFEGLQEDWFGTSGKKGTFHVNNDIPKFGKNVKLYIGWFDQTIPKFVSKLNDEEIDFIPFIHIDGDTYEASNEVLYGLSSFIKKGTVILFDEYLGYPGWQFGEYKSFQEFCKNKNIKYKYISFTTLSVCVEIL